MTKMLITGANKGLGLEAAKRLVAEGHEMDGGPGTPNSERRPRGLSMPVSFSSM
jgi:hypothetical protein